MAKRVVDGFQRVLGMAIGFRLAETDVGQLALEEVGEPVVLRGRLAAAIGGEAGKAGLLPLEMVLVTNTACAMRASGNSAA